jgi:CDGSH-type Zn-finger protein
MSEAVVAQKAPYANDIEAGKRYAWCSCGQSRKQPFCDGSHKATDFMPVIVEAEVTKVVYFCGCKKTKNQPYCDGSHNTL